MDDAREEDLPLFYSASDVYVQPSIWEGFGLPILEAMACGTPVVSTTAASLPEIVGSAGLLVEPRDPVGLALAILRVLDDSNLAERLSESGIARVHEFTWEQTAAETRSTYERPISSTRTRMIGGHVDRLEDH